MKFSLSPGVETGFSQWLDAMKMVVQLPGGMPAEFRMKLWLQLSEKHLNDHNIDWEKAEAIIFNEWTNPDDEELGVQIVKVSDCPKATRVDVLCGDCSALQAGVRTHSSQFFSYSCYSFDTFTGHISFTCPAFGSIRNSWIIYPEFIL